MWSLIIATNYINAYKEGYKFQRETLKLKVAHKSMWLERTAEVWIP